MSTPLRPGHYEAIIVFRRVGDEQAIIPETTLRLHVLLPVAEAGPVFDARNALWAALASCIDDQVRVWRAAKASIEKDDET